MSGGVDSSVAAKLLLDQGYEVIGVFMKTWDTNDPHCPASEDAADARSVAAKLSIPLYVFDFSKEYWRDVFEYFLEQNRQGRTPNPDILCNKYIKFEALWQKARELGADCIATGHYVSLKFNKNTEKSYICVPKDKGKDQTYFLYTLTQEQLARTLFPLADIEKKEVRRIARDLGLVTADKKDSVGICMVGDRNYTEFLQHYVSKSPGNIIDADTKKVVGEHMGLSFYTIGQRKTLGIGGVKGFPEAPWFVIKKDFKTNELVVSQDEEKLLGTDLMAINLHWISGSVPAKKFQCMAKIRYRSESTPCYAELVSASPESGSKSGMTMNVTFDSPVRAISPGQSVVFYDGDVCLGGGEIV